jgi:hypothetical protein
VRRVAANNSRSGTHIMTSAVLRRCTSITCRAARRSAAEGVLGGLCVEPVGGELFLAARQLELFRRHDEVQKTILVADRAVALGDVRQVDGGSKPTSPAVAAAFERSHALHPHHVICGRLI